MFKEGKKLQKTTIISVISIFILCSLSYQPIIADTPIEVEDITINIFGLNRLENQRLTISKEDSERIDAIFDDLRNGLDKSETIEETVIIYNDALKELDNLGILGDIDFNELQNTITGNILSRRYLISGELSNSGFIAPIGLILSDILSWILELSIFRNELWMFLYIIQSLISYYSYVTYHNLKLGRVSHHLNGVIYFSSRHTTEAGMRTSTSYHKAKGWIEVQDKLDVITDETVNYTGTLYGDLREFNTYTAVSISKLYVGIEGFKGIGITSSPCNLNLIGSASRFAVR